MWLLYLPLVIPALAGLAARPLAALLEPRQATWLLTIAAVALAACSPPRWRCSPPTRPPGHPSWPRWATIRSRSSGAVTPSPLPPGRSPGWRWQEPPSPSPSFSATGRARWQSPTAARPSCMDDGVVVVPGPAIEAYALPGRPGRIVVSDRLLDRLDAGGRTALIAHEQAHLSGRHYLFAAAARLAAAANPMLLPVARSVDYTVERWADEHAAAVTGDRGLVAETIGQVALLAGPRPARPPRMSLGILGHAPGACRWRWPDRCPGESPPC